MLSDVLKSQREHLKLKQAEIAEYVGVTPQTYMKWENGKNEPKASDLKKLSEILHISANEIVEGRLYTPIDPIAFMREFAKLEGLLDVVTKTDILMKYISDMEGVIRELKIEVRKRTNLPEELDGQIPLEVERDLVENKKIEDHIAKETYDL